MPPTCGTPAPAWNGSPPAGSLPITGELKVGGRFQLEGNASGEVLTCDPPRTFTTTWEAMGATSWVEVTITEAGEGRATFTLDHIMHADDHDEFWLQFGPGAVGVGWDSGLLGLAGYLGSGDRITPEEGGLGSRRRGPRVHEVRERTLVPGRVGRRRGSGAGTRCGGSHHRGLHRRLSRPDTARHAPIEHRRTLSVCLTSTRT